MDKFQPRQLFGETPLYRGTYKSRAKKIPPIGAFYRKDSDTDGISLAILAWQCFERQIDAILTITPQAIEDALVLEKARNAPSDVDLKIIQDSATHAIIQGAPFQSRDPIGAENVATILALACNRLSDADVAEAKQVHRSMSPASEAAPPTYPN